MRIRTHQVFDGKSLAQKFRVAGDVKLHLGFAIALNGLGHLVACLHRNGALIDNDFVTRHGGGDFPRHRLDETQIYRTIRLRRGRHGDEDDVGSFNSLAR